MLLFPVIAYWRYRQGERAAFFYMVGWAAFFMVGGWSVLALEGWMPYRGYLVDDIKLALLATGLLLTLGVGVRLRELQRKQQDTAREVLRAEAQNSAKSEFLATMSHEIRTPMSGVLGMIDLLRVSGLSQEQQRIVSTIATSGEGLLTVINDILDYSRVESGRMSLDVQEFDLMRVLVESLTLFKVRSYRKGLRLLGSVSARTPVRVLGDSVRLRQILINLLANAVKYTDRGRIDLMVTSRRISQGVRLEFAVKDTGSGIPESSLEHIFDSFQQGDRPQKHEGSSGLGLAICRRICQLMGGDISVESHLHQGSTFSFWVELGVPLLPSPPVDWPAGLACRLLLVDYDLEYLELMSREAALPDLSIDTAMSGAECLSMLKQAEADGNPFGLVVTELQLVDMNGLSLRQRMAELQLTQLTELIVMTQPYWQPNPGLLHQAGVAGAMERPVMGHEFRQSLANILLRDQVVPEGPPSTLASHRPLRILVAEDNPTNQMVLVGMLRRLGMEPEVVADGEQACSRIQTAQHAYDLILMDCEMPVCDGFEAARRIREMEQQQGKPRTPMLAVTAHVTRPHILACYEAGMDDHLPKPISPADLRTKLEHWVVL
ncbi:MAG: response regulator [Pseudomonadales bacterium]|nr:response regulator [Pseudomonadales bacterium]